MHAELTHKIHSDASLTRRGFLAGAASLPVAGAPVAVSAAMIAPNSELADLVATYRRLRALIGVADDKVAAIHARPDRPEWPTVSVSDVSSRVVGNRRFQSLTEIDDYRAAQRDAGYAIRWAPELRQAWDEMRALYIERAAAHDQWYVDTGYETLQDEIDELSELQSAAIKKIVSLQCRSMADVALKIDWLGEAFDLDAEHITCMPDFLKTIRDFASGEA